MADNLWKEFTEWLNMLDETSQLLVPPMVLSAASVFQEIEVFHQIDLSAIPQNVLICKSMHLFPQDPCGFHYWISHALVSERQGLESHLLVSLPVVMQTWHPLSDGDAPQLSWLQHIPGHLITTFAYICQLIALFTALAFHESDNYAKCAVILWWTTSFEVSTSESKLWLL
ncbi:hypothetical protein EDC04DRAFT_2890946 [Pisolithus marmoratus]|nr:hypothetical protein EDC04DRAFT_2890946 [Pisolithus marmoratus]